LHLALLIRVGRQAHFDAALLASHLVVVLKLHRCACKRSVVMSLQQAGGLG